MYIDKLNQCQKKYKGIFNRFSSDGIFSNWSFFHLRFIVVLYIFESILIPMYLIVGVWGSRERKIRAAYFFFLYTLLGSVLMLLSILYIYYQAGTTDYEVLLTFIFSKMEQNFL